MKIMILDGDDNDNTVMMMTIMMMTMLTTFAQELSQHLQISHVETSARSGKNVE